MATSVCSSQCQSPYYGVCFPRLNNFLHALSLYCELNGDLDLVILRKLKCCTFSDGIPFPINIFPGVQFLYGLAGAYSADLICHYNHPQKNLRLELMFSWKTWGSMVINEHQNQHRASG